MLGYFIIIVLLSQGQPCNGVCMKYLAVLDMTDLLYTHEKFELPLASSPLSHLQEMFLYIHW